MAEQTPAVEQPDARSADVRAMAEPWPMVDALLGGTFAMRKAGETFLIKKQVETPEAYQKRLQGSTLYGAFKRAVHSMAARPFAEAIKYGEEMPEKVRALVDDIDLEGRDLQAFAHHSFEVAMAYGLSHILVEYPHVDGTKVRTLADQRAMGARPYWVHVHPKNVLGWRAERIAGVQTLTQLRILECVTEPDGRWSEREVAQIRVFDRVVRRDENGKILSDATSWTTYRKNQADVWVPHADGPVSIGCIPLATIYAKRTGFMTAEPPLLDLAHLNVEHWNSASVQMNLLGHARIPILFGAGWEEGQTFTVGANAGITHSSTDAKLTYVEHTGKAIEAGQVSLDKLEQRMSVMGMELLISKPGVKTATEAAIDTDGSTSPLQAMVNNLEDSIALALSLSAKWLGLGDAAGCTVELDGDFTALDPLDVQTFVQAKEAGCLSAETIFRSMQTHGIIDEELTWEDERQRIAQDAKPREAAPANPSA